MDSYPSYWLPQPYPCTQQNYMHSYQWGSGCSWSHQTYYNSAYSTTSVATCPYTTRDVATRPSGYYPTDFSPYKYASSCTPIVPPQCSYYPTTVPTLPPSRDVYSPLDTSISQKLSDIQSASTTLQCSALDLTIWERRDDTYDTTPSDISIDRYLDDSVLDTSPLDTSDVTTATPSDDIIDVTSDSPLDTAMVVATPPPKRKRTTKTSLAKKLLKIPVLSRSSQKSCPICQKEFATKLQLVLHVSKDHEEGSLTELKCPQCPRTFYYKNSLWAHVKTHGGKQFKCSKCNKSFAHQSTLNKHEKIHTGSRPYACAVCHKTFSQSGNMLRHQRTVHKTQ